MFDLFRRKDTNLRIVLGVLLGLVALSMVVTLIPGFGSGGFGAGAGEETVGKVCGESISAKEVRQRLQQLLARQELPPGSAAIFIPQYIDQYVAVKGVACYANEAGMLTSDKEMALKIQKDVPQFWQEGKFVGRAMYEAMLKQGGMTVAQFEGNVKQEIETKRLRSLVLMSALATPKEVEEYFRESEEKIKLEYLVIDPALLTREAKISDAEIQAEYEKNKSAYTQPASRSVSLYTFESSQVASNVQITEADLKRLYSENMDNFRVPERANVRHILFSTKDKPESEDKVKRQLAETVFKQLKAGAKFEDMVTKYSDDPGSKSNGGSVGFITRGQTVKNFDEYSFGGPLKTLSSPIKTEFGYHLIEVIERQNAGLRTFEEVKPFIEAEARKAQVGEGFLRFGDQVRAQLLKNSKQVPEIAAKLGITPLKFEYPNANTNIPGLGAKPDIFGKVLTLKVGEVSEVISLSPERIALVVVDSAIPARPSTFEEARLGIQATKAIAAGNAKTVELKEKGAQLMKTYPGDLARIAKELNVPTKETQEFNRQGFADGLGPAGSIVDAFGKKVGDLVGPVTVDAKWFIVKVVSKTEADMNLLPARRAELINNLKNRKASERADIFEETLIKRMIAEGKIKVMEDAKKRIVSSFSN